MKLSGADKFAATVLERLLPNVARAQAVNVDLLNGLIVVSDLNVGKVAKVGKCRICWSAIAFLTPLTPFLDLEIHDVDCTIAELAALCRPPTVEENPSGAQYEPEAATDKTSIFAWVIRFAIGLVVSLTAFVLTWILATILSNVRITLTQCTVIQSNGATARVSGVQLEVGIAPTRPRGKSLYEQLVSPWTDPRLSVASRVSRLNFESGLCNNQATIEVEGIATTLQAGTAQDESSVAVASMRVLVLGSDEPLVHLGPARLKLARLTGDAASPTARLDAEFYHAAGKKIADIAAVKRSPGTLDVRARVLECIELHISSKHIALLRAALGAQPTDDGEISAPQVAKEQAHVFAVSPPQPHSQSCCTSRRDVDNLFTQTLGSLSIRNMLKCTVIEFQFNLKSAVTLNYDSNVSLTIDRQTKLSTIFDGAKLRFTASVPLVCAVTASAAANLTLESVEVRHSVDGLTLTVASVETRIDSSFPNSEDAVSVKKLLDLVKAGSMQGGSPNSFAFVFNALDTHLLLDGASVFELHNVDAKHATGVIKVSCESACISNDLAVLSQGEGGEPALEALYSLKGDVRDVSLGHVSLHLEDTERDYIHSISDLLCYVKHSAFNRSHELRQHHDDTMQRNRGDHPLTGIVPGPWRLRLAGLSCNNGRFEISASQLDLQPEHTGCNRIRLTCSCLPEKNREMFYCEFLRIESRRATSRRTRVSYVSQAWNECVSDVQKLVRRFEMLIFLQGKPECENGVRRYSAFASTRFEADSFVFVLPVAAQSQRRFVLEGSEATLRSDRASLRAPTVLNHEGRVVATLGTSLNAAFDHNRLSAIIRCPVLSSMRFEVQDYLALRHTVWRNIAGGDEYVHTTASDREGTGFRFEVCAGAVDVVLVDDGRRSAFRVEAQTAALVIDRSAKSSNFFVMTSHTANVQILPWPKLDCGQCIMSSLSHCNSAGLTMQNFTFAVSPVKTSLHVAFSEILWHADRATWWQLRDFFSFGYVRDVDRDGPLILLNSLVRTQPASQVKKPVEHRINQQLAFELELVRSTISFSLTSRAIKINANSARYVYRWWTESDASHHCFEICDFIVAMSAQLSGSATSFSYDTTKKQATLELAQVTAPTLAALKDSTFAANDILGSIILTCFGGSTEGISMSSNFALRVKDSTLKIAKEWAFAADNFEISAASHDATVNNLTIRGSPGNFTLGPAPASAEILELIFRLERVSTLPDGEVALGELAVDSIPGAIALLRVVQNTFQADRLSAVGSPHDGIFKRVAITKLKVAVTRYLTFFVGSVVTDAEVGTFTVGGGFWCEHRGISVLQTSGTIKGSSSDVRIQTIDLQWSQQLEAEFCSALSEISRTILSVTLHSPAAASSIKERGTLHFSMKEVFLSHADLDSKAVAAIEGDIDKSSFDISEVQVQIKSAGTYNSSVLRSPTTLRLRHSNRKTSIDVSPIQTSVMSLDVAQFVAGILRRKSGLSIPHESPPSKDREHQISVVCRGINFEIVSPRSNGHDAVTLQVVAEEFFAEFSVDFKWWSLAIAGFALLTKDGQALACLEQSSVQGDAASEDCYFAVRRDDRNAIMVFASKPLWMALSDNEIFHNAETRRARLTIRAESCALACFERLLVETGILSNAVNEEWPLKGSVRQKNLHAPPFRLSSCKLGVRIILVKKSKSLSASSGYLQHVATPTSKPPKRSPFVPALGSDEVCFDVNVSLQGSTDCACIDVRSVRAACRHGVNDEDVLFEVANSESVLRFELKGPTCTILIPSPKLIECDKSVTIACIAAVMAAIQRPAASEALRRAALVMRAASPGHNLRKASWALDIVASCVEEMLHSCQTLFSRDIRVCNLSSTEHAISNNANIAPAESRVGRRESLPSKLSRYKVAFSARTLGLTLTSGSQNGKIHIAHVAADSVPGDVVVSVNGSLVKDGVRCADVAKAIAEAGRPVTLELERSLDQSRDATSSPLSGARGNIKNGDYHDEEYEQARYLLRTTDIEFVLIDCSDHEDFCIRLLLRQLRVEYQHGSAPIKVHVSGLQLAARRLGEWEPVLEPSSIHILQSRGCIDMAIRGDDAVDGQLGDGDSAALRVNVSIPLVRAMAAFSNLLCSASSMAACASYESAIDHDLVIRDDFFGNGVHSGKRLAASLSPDGQTHRQQNEVESGLSLSKEPPTVVIRIESLRLSIIGGGHDDVPHKEALVLSIKGVVVDYAATAKYYRLNVSTEDAQLDSHSVRFGGAPSFPVMMRTRPKRRRLVDVIGSSSVSARRPFIVASAIWGFFNEDLVDRIVITNLRVELGKIDVYIDERDARDGLQLAARLIDEFSAARRKDVLIAPEEPPTERSFVFKCVDISKVDARLSVRWSSSDDDEYASSESERLAHSCERNHRKEPTNSVEANLKRSNSFVGTVPKKSAHGTNVRPLPTIGNGRQNTLYAESLASMRATRGPLTGTRTTSPFASSSQTYFEGGTLRALLKVFAAVEMSKITLPSMRVRETKNFANLEEVICFARSHYSRGAARNALEIVGSLRAIGNPLGLARGVLRGIEDLVREPVQGLIEGVDDAAPEAFALGLRRGASSLVRHTVGGTADSLACITGNFSRAASHLAFDGDYRRRQARKDIRRGVHTGPRSKDAALFEGLADGFDSAVGGLVDGVTGLVQAPIRGAERGGAAGAIRGVGKGVLGLVVKPVVGVADAATDVLRGIRATTDADAAAQRSAMEYIENSTSSSRVRNEAAGSLSPRQSEPLASPISGNLVSSVSARTESHTIPDNSSPEDVANLEDGAAADVDNFDQNPAQQRPTRALYGSFRHVRAYSLRDAYAAASLRYACRETNGVEPPGVDAFRQRVVLDQDGSVLVISDGAIAVIRLNMPSLVVAPVSRIIGCSLDTEECCAVILVASSANAYAASPPDRHSIRCSSISIGQTVCTALAHAMARSRDAMQREIRRLSTNALRST